MAIEGSKKTHQEIAFEFVVNIKDVMPGTFQKQEIEMIPRNIGSKAMKEGNGIELQCDI